MEVVIIDKKLCSLISIIIVILMTFWGCKNTHDLIQASDISGWQNNNIYFSKNNKIYEMKENYDDIRTIGEFESMEIHSGLMLARKSSNKYQVIKNKYKKNISATDAFLINKNKLIYVKNNAEIYLYNVVNQQKSYLFSLPNNNFLFSANKNYLIISGQENSKYFYISDYKGKKKKVTFKYLIPLVDQSIFYKNNILVFPGINSKRADFYGPSRLYSCNLESGKIKFLTENVFPKEKYNQQLHPKLSPDKKAVAFINKTSTKQYLILYYFKKNNYIVLDKGNIGIYIAWAPDSKSIAYSKNGYLIIKDIKSL